MTERPLLGWEAECPLFLMRNGELRYSFHQRCERALRRVTGYIHEQIPEITRRTTAANATLFCGIIIVDTTRAAPAA